LEPSHNQQWQFLRDEILGIAPLQYMNIIRPLAHHVWSGEKQFVSAQEFAMALAESSDTPVSVREKIINSPLFSAKQT
jgi:hypothetical protein